MKLHFLLSAHLTVTWWGGGIYYTYILEKILCINIHATLDYLEFLSWLPWSVEKIHENSCYSWTNLASTLCGLNFLEIKVQSEATDYKSALKLVMVSMCLC